MTHMTKYNIFCDEQHGFVKFVQLKAFKPPVVYTTDRFLLGGNNEYLSTVKSLAGPLSAVEYHRAASSALWYL